MGEVIEIFYVLRFIYILGVCFFLMGVVNVCGCFLFLVDLFSFFDIFCLFCSLCECWVLVVEEGDVFSGLVVDSVLGMQYFVFDSFKVLLEGVFENVWLFVIGGYECNEEVWKVFLVVDLFDDECFFDVVQWQGVEIGRNIILIV